MKKSGTELFDTSIAPIHSSMSFEYALHDLLSANREATNTARRINTFVAAAFTALALGSFCFGKEGRAASFAAGAIIPLVFAQRSRRQGNQLAARTNNLGVYINSYAHLEQADKATPLTMTCGQLRELGEAVVAEQRLSYPIGWGFIGASAISSLSTSPTNPSEIVITSIFLLLSGRIAYSIGASEHSTRKLDLIEVGKETSAYYPASLKPQKTLGLATPQY